MERHAFQMKNHNFFSFFRLRGIMVPQWTRKRCVRREIRCGLSSFVHLRRIISRFLSTTIEHLVLVMTSKKRDSDLLFVHMEKLCFTPWNYRNPVKGKRFHYQDHNLQAGKSFGINGGVVWRVVSIPVLRCGLRYYFFVGISICPRILYFSTNPLEKIPCQIKFFGLMMKLIS